MTPSSGVALFTAMMVLALLPSISTLTVAARSASRGFAHGALTAAGIVAGDIVFIVIAILGLKLIADSAESVLTALKYLGGAYLIWLGIRMWRFRPELHGRRNIRPKESLAYSFLMGLLITLADQKAILFYLVFFPAFIDLNTVTFFDAVVIGIIALLAVGGAKLGYAWLADGAGLLVSSRFQRLLSGVAAAIMLVVGVFVILKP